MIEPKLPETVYLLFWHGMSEGWDHRFYIREARAYVAWKHRPGSRLYVLSADERWREID